MLIAWSDGRREAFDDLMPMVYEDLCRPAVPVHASSICRTPLQPTVLVGEAFLRVLDQCRVGDLRADRRSRARSLKRPSALLAKRK